jgi:hypothetical protein
MGVLLWLDSLPLWQLGLLLFGLFSVAALIGRSLHRERRRDEESGDSSYIISASLGLLALLLGFSVSLAVARYDLRRAANVQEANAIGTFIYRTDLMPEAPRRTTLAELDRYIAARIRVGQMGERPEGVAEAREITNEAAAALWDDVLAARAQVPDQAVQVLIVESANMMFDMAAARDAALANRLPPTLVALLIFFPFASLVLIGYVSGKSMGVHLMASTELILLLTFVLLLIADLNSPRSGTIRIPIDGFLAVQEQLRDARARTSQ